MTELSSIRISPAHPNRDGTYHGVHAAEGVLQAWQSPDGDTYDILDLYAFSGDSGDEDHTSELFRFAQQHARELGATALTASLATGPAALLEASPELRTVPNTSPDYPNNPAYTAVIRSAIDSVDPGVKILNTAIRRLSVRHHDFEEKVKEPAHQPTANEMQEYQEVTTALNLAIKQRDRLIQKNDAQASGCDLRFVDEINLEEYSHILKTPDLPASFRVPAGIAISDKRQASSALEALPFFKKPEGRLYDRPKHRETLVGQLHFPVDRIIGIESFQSWAGRGYSPRDSNPDYSLEKIVDFAQKPAEKFRGHSAAHIEIVKDEDGNLWGVASNDGSHRIAAAKLRGDQYVEVSQVDIPADMYTLPLRVAS